MKGVKIFGRLMLPDSSMDGDNDKTSITYKKDIPEISISGEVLNIFNPGDVGLKQTGKGLPAVAA